MPDTFPGFPREAQQTAERRKTEDCYLAVFGLLILVAVVIGALGFIVQDWTAAQHCAQIAACHG